MSMESVARRYARAVFELANERGDSLDAWLDDLRTMQTVLEERTIAGVLAAPNVSVAEKRRMVDEVVRGLDPLRTNLLYMLVDGGRIEAIGGIAREFHRLVNERRGIVEATVTTAVALSETERSQVAGQLGRMLGKNVVVDWRVDPSIIGGVVARVGDTLINGSVADRLAALREQLV